MYSRIIQIAPHPIPNDEWYVSALHECDHWFRREVSECITEDKDRDETLRALRECFECMGDNAWFFKDRDTGNTGVMFSNGFKELYFAEKFELYKKRLDTITGKLSMDNFCTYNLPWLTKMLCDAVDDKEGFYIDDEEYDIETLDAFIRSAQCDTPYYFGETADYHY